jgi:hypothetical protein
MKINSDSQEDNSYVNVSILAREMGFKRPVMLSLDVHHRLLPDQYENAAGQSYLHRLLEMLSFAMEAIEAHKGNEIRIPFQAFLLERAATGHWLTLRVELWCCRQGKGYVIGRPEEGGL